MLVSLSGPDYAMGSWLSKVIQKRLKKGVNLKTKAGGGVLSFDRPGSPSAPSSSAPGAGGPLAMLKNPMVLAGIGVVGLGVVFMVMRKRKGKRK